MRSTQHAALPAAFLICASALALVIALPRHESQAAVETVNSISVTTTPDSPPPEEETSCQVSSEFPRNILRWCDLISMYATENNLEPDLLAALMLIESSGDPEAISSNGAVGLLQVMPRDGLAAEFMCPNGPCFSSRPNTQELLDPKFNMEYGSGMLASLVGRTGSLREALLHYGPIDVGYTYADTVLQMRDRYAGLARVME